LRRFGKVLILCLFLIPAGCERGGVSPLSLVQDLMIMGVSTEPAQIIPGEDISVKLLWVDPAGNGRNVWFVWRMFWTECDDEVCFDHKGQPPFIGSHKNNGDVFLVPGSVTQQFLAGEDDSPLFISVFVCAGGVTPTAKELEESASWVDLCEGNFFSAIKSVRVFDAMNPQANPVIERLLLNGEEQQPRNEGGHKEFVCGETCDLDVLLDLHLDSTSFEMFSVEVEEDVFEDYEETIHISWFSTGGALMNERSSVTEAGESFTNRWRLTQKGTYTLWAVSHDSRGGASWETYEVELK
jgi:hypothetical protein